MKLKVLLIILLIFNVLTIKKSFGQAETVLKKNTINFTLGLSTHFEDIYIGTTYERRLITANKFSLGGEIGFGYISSLKDEAGLGDVSYPVFMMNLGFGQMKLLEISIGRIYTFDERIRPLLSFGYKWFSKNRRNKFKISVGMGSRTPVPNPFPLTNRQVRGRRHTLLVNLVYGIVR
jgi:hypothetical protein